MRTLIVTLFLLPLPAFGADTIQRATANLNGVTSARGFFNITVRLYQLPGVEWVKFDLKKSMITLDFEPGVMATQAAIKSVVSGAGYKPGSVSLEQVEKPAKYDHSLGWNRIRRPTATNAIGRWFQLNF